jgi:hypothetical protein
MGRRSRRILREAAFLQRFLAVLLHASLFFGKPQVLHFDCTKNRTRASAIPVHTFSFLSTPASRKTRK